MALFTHEDDEGDELEVMEALNDHRGQLVFNFTCRRNSSGVFVTHDRVAALHAALGEWLGRADVVSMPIQESSPLDQLITRRVDEAVARVLPLHMAPQAYVPEPDAEDGREPVRPYPMYEDARPDRANRLLSDLTRMADVAKRTAQTTREGAGTWGTGGTSPNGPVPQCQARGCGHGYAAHREYPGAITGYKQCTECPCVRYRSTS